jgi:hypothetical protein
MPGVRGLELANVGLIECRANPLVCQNIFVPETFRRSGGVEWLSMSRLKFAHLSIDVIKLAILRWVVWRVRALRCFESPRTGFGSPSRRSMLALLAFVSFSPTLDPFGVGTEMRCVLHAPSRRGERLISRTTACERPCARL